MYGVSKAAREEVQSQQQQAVQQLQQDMKLHLAQNRHAMIVQQPELTGEVQQQVKGMQQQLHSLQASSRRQYLVMHAPASLGREGLREECITMLALASGRLFQMPLAAYCP